MKNTNSFINRIVSLMLDLANEAEERQETPFAIDLKIGYRCFSSYIRKGCQDIIDMQQEYYSMKESHDMAIANLNANEKFLYELFGDLEITEFNEGEKARIKAVVQDIKKEWDESKERTKG